MQTGRCDAQSDLYALGAVLYEAISGRALRGPAAMGAPSPVLCPRSISMNAFLICPKELARVVMQLLSPRPELRQRDAFVLLDELTAIVADHADSAPVISQKAPLSQPRSSVDASLELPPDTLRAGEPPSLPSSVTSALKGLVVPASTPSAREYRSPDTGTRPLSELEPLCREGLLKIERAVATYAQRPPLADGLLTEVRRLIELIVHAGAAVGTDQAKIAELEAKALETKGGLGRALDVLGHDLSRANALVADLNGRITKLKEKREGARPNPANATRGSGKRGRSPKRRPARAAGVTTFHFKWPSYARGSTNRSKEWMAISAQARAVLEGHVADLRAQAREAWSSIEQAAQQLGVPMNIVGPEDETTAPLGR